MKPVLISLTALLLVLGCTKGSISSNNKSKDVFPDKIGDTWVYHVTNTTVNGNDSTALQYDMNVSVTDSVRLPGGIIANVWIYKFLNTTDTNYVYQNGDTVKFLDKTKSFPLRQYIIPFSLHNSWQYIPGDFPATIDAQGDINVGVNDFPDAFHLHVNANAGLPDASFGIDEWIENNVGVVTRSIYPLGLIFLKHVISWSLVSYHLK